MLFVYIVSTNVSPWSAILSRHSDWSARKNVPKNDIDFWLTSVTEEALNVIANTRHSRNKERLTEHCNNVTKSQWFIRNWNDSYGDWKNMKNFGKKFPIQIINEILMDGKIFLSPVRNEILMDVKKILKCIYIGKT